MKKVLLVSITVMVFIGTIYSQDVRGLTWGMNKSAVKRIESSKGITFHTSNLETMLTGTGTVDGKYCLLIYSFDYTEKTLIAIGMAFDKPMFGSLKDRADELLDILESKYGSYKNVTTDYGNRPAYIWKTRRTKITLVPKTTKGNIAINYESLVKPNKSKDF